MIKRQRNNQNKLNKEIIFYDENVCTCKDTCSFNCKGECGCKACQEAYADYLTEDYE